MKKDYVVTGVFREINQPSHLTIDLLTTFKAMGFRKWNIFSCVTYVTLQEGTDITEFRDKLIKNYTTYAKKAKTGFFTSSVDFQPIREINLLAATDSEKFKGNPGLHLVLLAIVALIILIIASMNYVNLSIAKLTTQTREVGLRKIIGARQSQLIWQSIIESIILILTASLAALIITELAQPVVNNIIGKPLSFQIFQRLSVFAIGLFVITLTVIVAAIFIAVMFAASNPAEILKNQIHKSVKGVRLIRGLVGFQFLATITLVIVSIVIMQQLQFMNSKNLGFDKENILVIDDHVDVTDNHAAALKNEIKKVPGVINAAFGELPFRERRNEMYEQPYFAQIDGTLRLRELEVGQDYLETLKIKILQGRGFSAERMADAPSNAILINEAAVKQFGWENPVGKSYTIRKEAYQIIGVFEDIHLGSLYEFIWPTLLEFDEITTTLLVRIKSGDLRNTISELEKVWHQFAPHSPMHYYFLDQKIDEMYHHEKRMSSIILVFTILTMLIACTGLYGMISYIANQRTKEIGIRKVLGGTISNILFLLSKDYILLIGISNIIAWPIAWFVMNRWLQNFAYRIEMNWWMFVLAGSLALLVALLTMSFQAIRAAMANPVESLRYE